MGSPSTPSTPAEAAAIIADGHRAFRAEFDQITRRAQSRFERREWLKLQHDATERLDLYERHVGRTIHRLDGLLESAITDRSAWRQIKPAFAQRIVDLNDAELAETFFNSVTRRVFKTVGVDAALEFAEPRRPDALLPSDSAACRTFAIAGDTADAVRSILEYCAFAATYNDLPKDAARIAQRIDRAWTDAGHAAPIDRLEILRSIFYRGQGAYLVGRVVGQDHTMPLAIALRNSHGSVTADAALVTEDDVSILFSFTRSYFHVETDAPRELIAFLRSIMPLKRVAELYMAIGFHKHGKTELYRTFLEHLERSDDAFQFAQGDRGLVMVVFTLPSFEIVFKIIRDSIQPPKDTTRQQVIEKYDLVFKHDRAGRLVEAQEFEHLVLPRNRFHDDLLNELTTSAAGSVTITDDTVDLHHVYAERRIRPLNLYLREVSDGDARRAVSDYGQAVKDLAAANIFPGDLLPKNFGVTRHDRVVFYDYDELCLLTDCHFRDLPTARDETDEMRGEPWFYVGPDDIFPEEFINFIGIPKNLREVFLEEHADVLTPKFWRKMQARHAAGQIVDILPYRPEKRLHHNQP